MELPLGKDLTLPDQPLNHGAALGQGPDLICAGLLYWIFHGLSFKKIIIKKKKKFLKPISLVLASRDLKFIGQNSFLLNNKKNCE